MPGMRSSTALTDTDIAYDILTCSKTLASDYTKAALEAADPHVRRTFRQLGRDCERLAFQAFEYLNQHGQYEVKPASQQEIRQVEDLIHRLTQPSAGRSMRPYDAERAPLPDWARARD